MQQQLAVMISGITIIGTCWLVNQNSPTTQKTSLSVEDRLEDSRFEFNAFVDVSELSEEEYAERTQWIRNFGPKARREYIQNYFLKEIAAEFPIRSGMTISEMDEAIAKNEEEFDASDLDQVEEMYNLGWEKRSIENGNGWVYFWVNFKHLFHCNIVIESGNVKSVWIMPGNAEWSTGIYYRISGSGKHQGPGRIY